jgi:hypothetical protein
MYRTQPPQAPIQWLRLPRGIGVPLAELDRVLGRPYAWCVEDDENIRRLLLAAGAPVWCDNALGELLDEDIWFLCRPRGYIDK